jgi:hypothetical protein
MITLSKTVKVYPKAPIIINELRYTLVDDGISAYAKFNGFPILLPLWSSETNPSYFEAGDYTQKQADERVVELLGPTPEVVLQSLLPVGTPY